MQRGARFEGAGRWEKLLVRTTLAIRVLQRARDVCGDHRTLAAALRITQADLASLLIGTDKPTRSVFLAAVEIIVASEGAEEYEKLASLHPAAERDEYGPART
jgi:hypothetical protein